MPCKVSTIKKIIKPHSSPCNQQLLEKKSPGVPGSDKDPAKWDPFIFCWLKKKVNSLGMSGLEELTMSELDCSTLKVEPKQTL